MSLPRAPLRAGRVVVACLFVAAASLSLSRATRSATREVSATLVRASAPTTPTLRAPPATRPLRGVVAISTATDAVCARLRDGSLRRWGAPFDDEAPPEGITAQRSVARPAPSADDPRCVWPAPSDPDAGITWQGFRAWRRGPHALEVESPAEGRGCDLPASHVIPFATPLEEVVVDGGAACVRERSGEVSCHRFARPTEEGWVFAREARELTLLRGAVGVAMFRAVACAWSATELRCARVNDTLAEGVPSRRTPSRTWRLPAVTRAWPGPHPETVCAATRDGAVWCAGATHGPTPQRLHEEPALRGAVELGWRVPPMASDASLDGGCARTAEGRAVCWGNDRWLGDGALVRSAVPVRVRGVYDAVALQAGGRHACALTRAGRLWCWGEGRASEGAPHATGIPTPVADGVRGFETGDAWSNALTSDGAVVGWGVPVTFLPGSAQALEIAARITRGVRDVPARRTRCAVRDGAAWCEGERPGDGRWGDAAEPARVRGLRDVREVAVGEAFACARTGEGAVWCWGENDRGQLGDGRAVHGGGVREVLEEVTR